MRTPSPALTKPSSSADVIHAVAPLPLCPAQVLSVVSSQIRTIQDALKNGARRFQFEGREVRLDTRTGIFITMNPGCET